MARQISLRDVIEQAQETGILDLAGSGLRTFPDLSDPNYDVDDSFYPEVTEISKPDTATYTASCNRFCISCHRSSLGSLWPTTIM
jgi:hypothetical protein